MQHGLNTNLVSKWIRLIDAKPGNDRSPLPNKPTFIALSCSAPLDPIPTGMLTVQITLPHSKAEIGLKWQVSEISALAELPLYTTNFTEPLSYQGSAFLKLPKFP